MPARRDTSSVAAALSGRPSVRLLPPPTTASGRDAACACATASPSSAAFAGRRVSIPCPLPLESRQLGEPELAAAHDGLAELGATMQHREHLSRVEQAFGV